VMLGVCYSLVKQLRQEPVITTVPPGVRTVVATMRPLPQVVEPPLIPVSGNGTTPDGAAAEATTPAS
jgi:glycine betaine transporter